MITKKQIGHFDAFGVFGELLPGTNFNFPLRVNTLTNIPKPETYKVISVKSSSIVDETVLDAFPKLELFVTRTVGTNHLDLAALHNRGIEVKTIPDYGAFSIAEHVFALLLTMTRKVISLDKQVRNGQFSSEHGQGYTLEGKTMGIVGLGRIGREIVRLSRSFRMQVIAYDMYPNPELADNMGFEFTTLDELLTRADVISLNVPLTEVTRKMIGAKQLDAMKDDSILINTSRGAIIDTAALIERIDKFRHVGLDVIEDEHAFSADHPLLSCNNVVITPHCAYFTDKSAHQIAEKTVGLIEEKYGAIR